MILSDNMELTDALNVHFRTKETRNVLSFERFSPAPGSAAPGSAIPSSRGWDGGEIRKYARESQK